MTLPVCVCGSIIWKGRGAILCIFRLIDTFSAINLGSYDVTKTFVNNIVSEGWWNIIEHGYEDSPHMA